MRAQRSLCNLSCVEHAKSLIPGHCDPPALGEVEAFSTSAAAAVGWEDIQLECVETVLGCVGDLPV